MNPFSALIDILVPRICHVCDRKLLDFEEFICSDCISVLPVTHYDSYWTNKSGVNSDLNPMEQRFAGQLPLVHACAPYFYARDTALASLIHDFKYRGFSRLAVTLGRLGAESLLSSGLFEGVDVLLPVPLHWTKKLRRGYNQTEMIAQGVSAVTGIPVGHQLKASKAHRTQTALSHEQRLRNTKNIFSLSDSESLTGQHLMLVDDICTTGATLLSAGETVAASLENNVKISIFSIGVV